MTLSTITMTCNSSGWSSPVRGSEFGIVSYDWSNAKQQWATATPMDCEERLLQQARMTKALNPSSRVFVYRNLVKALPWFTSVREKLDDPRYSGWFLRFNSTAPRSSHHVPACAAENSSKCSLFYHDQEQTPQVPTAAQPRPDGLCSPSSGCDCGTNPCGEYLWDHRNGSMLREWLLREHIGGPAGLGAPEISGLFVDDYWCSNTLCAKSNDTIAGCPCNDPVQGPTEIDRNAQQDMGLSDADIAELTMEWNATMTAFQRYTVEHGAYTWSLIPGQENANAMPSLLMRGKCAETLRAACSPQSSWQTQARLFGLTVNGSRPTQLQQDVAFFLLARGAYAWLGWGVWGMGWPFNPEPAHGELPPEPHGVPRPQELDQDYGTPLELCREDRPGLFTRRWSKVLVTLDCNDFNASIVPASPK